jgi:small subunit ribosomal protein S2
MVDTNSDPTLVEFPIPANDDASKSISLIINTVCEAIEEGTNERKMEREKEAASKEKEAKEKAEAEEGLEPEEGEAVLEKIEELTEQRKASEESASQLAPEDDEIQD